jgi:hypothetical protein
MSWSEFQSTLHYRAVWACPLLVGRSTSPRFVGCISVDVQANDAAGALETTIANNEDKIALYTEICEGVLE